MVQEVLAASKETGVAAGYVTDSPGEAEKPAGQGFRMVCPGQTFSLATSLPGNEALLRPVEGSERLTSLSSVLDQPEETAIEWRCVPVNHG